LKPKGNILAISVLLIAVSGLAGVCYGLKNQCVRTIGFSEVDCVYSNSGGPTPSVEPEPKSLFAENDWGPSSVPGIQTWNHGWAGE